MLRKGRRSMTYGFTFRCDGERLATGRVTSVCCELGAEEMCSIDIPDAIAAKIDQAPPEVTDETEEA